VDKPTAGVGLSITRAADKPTAGVGLTITSGAVSQLQEWA